MGQWVAALRRRFALRGRPVHYCAAMQVSSALVLCAGLGTRLRPLTDERPKPLIPVNDRPLAAHALGRLASVGVRDVVANAFHLATQVEPALRPWADRHAQSLRVLVEPTLLGTGGAIRNALPHLGDDFVVFNGDVLAAPDLSRAVDHHRRTNALLTLVLRDDPRAARLGAIEVDAEGRVRRILGEGDPPGVPVRACVFTGVYVVSRRVADDLPTEGCVVRHTLRRLLARGDFVGGVVDDGAWHDLGTPERYAEAQFALLRGELQGFPPGPPGAVWVAPTAVIDPGVHLEGPCIVGENARVHGEGTLSRAIVWPDAALDTPRSNVIVARTARVPIGDVR